VVHCWEHLSIVYDILCTKILALLPILHVKSIRAKWFIFLLLHSFPTASSSDPLHLGQVASRLAVTKAAIFIPTASSDPLHLTRWEVVRPRIVWAIVLSASWPGFTVSLKAMTPPSGYRDQYVLLSSLRTEFFEKISENAFFHRKWLVEKTIGTIRKCSSRAFRWMVMSVGFDNLNFLCNFCVPHQSVLKDLIYLSSKMTWIIFSDGKGREKAEIFYGSHFRTFFFKQDSS
jgi:hypothetical protein